MSEHTESLDTTAGRFFRNERAPAEVAADFAQLTSGDGVLAVWEGASAWHAELDTLGPGFFKAPALHIFQAEVLSRCRAFQALYSDLAARLQEAERERDAGREQLQKIGRKAFWAARPITRDAQESD